MLDGCESDGVKKSHNQFFKSTKENRIEPAKDKLAERRRKRLNISDGAIAVDNLLKISNKAKREAR